jgi:hypothetical protein
MLTDLGVGVADDTDGLGAEAVRVVQTSDHVGCSSRCRNPHDHVAIGQANGSQLAGRQPGVVLSPFQGVGKGSFSAGDEPDHLGRVRAKRWRALHGIQHSESSTGAGAQVDEPSAGIQGRYHQVHRLGNLWDCLAHCLRDPAVLGVHPPEQFGHRQGVKAKSVQIAGLGA